MNKLAFTEIKDVSSLELIASLANEIWCEHYTSIIGKDQVYYMLEKFQSVQAINDQIKNGYIYYVIKNEIDSVGYLSFKADSNNLFLSKLYIKSCYRGKGYGKQAIKFIEEYAKNEHLEKITLTVNKNNHNSIAVYKKTGFNTIEAIANDIGCGYVMDDYKMEKAVL